ncbi:helix-turn-helix transcriptional regulator [Arabiibacter massiliensis]|uniref:helix-turn-helix transcriptional regulator n=1 Tax=Arabiibacter massiliensis TaxID=1870985 RepID=UPI0009BB29A0|nr:helix-turn-helix transcriptional regulator [Arabiibacter massiliensis]
MFEKTFGREAVQFALCCLSLSLTYAIVLSLSEDVYAAVDAAPWMRIAASIVSCAVMVWLAFASTWRPSLLGSRLVTGVCAFLLCIGVVGLAWGFGGGGPLARAVGLSGLFAAGSLSALLVKAGCVSMGPGRILVYIIVSFLLGHVWSFAFSFVGTGGSIAVCVGVTVFALIASHPYYRPLLNRLKESEAPGALAAARPKAFLPFGHQVFIYLALFNFAHGYLLSFASTGASTPGALFTVATIAVIVLALIARKGRMFPDALFSVSVLFVIGGILLAPIAEVEGDLAAVLLSSGVACFNLLYLYTLLVISAKNQINTIPVLAWGACVEGVFMLAGEWSGTTILSLFASDHAAVSMLSIAVVMVILACILFTVRSFSFDRTIDGIEPDDALELSAHSARWENRCEEIAERCGLTPRECEVFRLLARGRNSPYIQKELVITNNTVKAHVKHIYQKLGVSSHQELIDLVDGRS